MAQEVQMLQSENQLLKTEADRLREARYIHNGKQTRSLTLDFCSGGQDFRGEPRQQYYA